MTVRKAFDKALGQIVDRPGWSAAILILMSLLGLSGYLAPNWIERTWQGVWGVADRQQDAGPPPATSAAAEPNVERLDLTGSDAIVVLHSEQFFSPDGTRAVRAAVEAIEQLEFVRGILWLDRAPPLNIFGLTQPLLPPANASASQFADARKRALEHPLVVGQMLSADGETLLLLVNFDWLFVQDDDDCTIRLREVAKQAVAAYPQAGITVQVTGRAPMLVTAMQAHELNQWKYQLIGYGMILLMAIILFRGIAAVVIVALAPSLGVFWTLGMLRFFSLQDNPFNDVVLPVLLSLVGLTDGVHLMVQIRRLRASGLTARDAARRGVREVGIACLLTSLTTAIGFGSLGMAHHQIVREFGYCCVLGVVLTFVAVMITIPLAVLMFGKWLQSGQEREVVERHLGWIAAIVDGVLQRPKTICAVAIVSTVVLTALSLALRPDDRASNSLPLHSEAALALQHLDKALGGLEFALVKVQWSAQVPSDAPEVLTVVGEVQKLIQQEPLLSHPLSVKDLIEALPGDAVLEDRVALLDLLPPQLKRAFYLPERREATVLCRVRDLGIARYGPVFERLEDGLTQLQARHPEFTLDLGGIPVWRWENLYQIVVDLASSLGSAAIIIFCVLGLVYRSVRIGLIAVIPNVFPLAFTGAYLYLTGQSLELVSVCAFTVCLGIAVDDTIHFLTRYGEEREQGWKAREALRRSFVSVGAALIMTTLVLVAGFITVMFSDSRDHHIFSTMGAITITTALLVDLLFLPPLLLVFGPPDPSPSKKDG